MGNMLHVQLFTPEALLLERDAVEVVAPGSIGEFGVLPNHINFASTMRPGRIVVRGTDGERLIVAVSGGFLEVTQDAVTILAERAEMAAGIDAERAREELAAAQRALEQLEPGAPAYRKALEQLAEARAKVAAVTERERARG